MGKIYCIDLRNKNKLINIEKSKIIDERMTQILLNFDKLIIKDFKSNPFFNVVIIFIIRFYF